MSFMPNQASRSCRLVTTNVLTRRRLSDMAAGETTVSESNAYLDVWSLPDT